MNQFSDSDSPDSEDGIRFKTDSTRNKLPIKSVREHSRSHHRRSRSRSAERRNHRKYDRQIDRSQYRSSSSSNSRRYTESSNSKDRYRHSDSKDRYYDRTKRDSSKVSSRRTSSIDRITSNNSSNKVTKTDTSSEKVQTVRGVVLTKTRKSAIEKETLIKNTDCSNSSNNSSEHIFGPGLPPKLIENNSEKRIDMTVDQSNCSKKEVEQVQSTADKLESAMDIDNDIYGPALPPKPSVMNAIESTTSPKSSKSPPYIGPFIPSNLRQKLADRADTSFLKPHSPTFSPCSPSYTPVSPNYSPDSPTYSPSSPNYSPNYSTGSTQRPTSRIKSPRGEYLNSGLVSPNFVPSDNDEDPTDDTVFGPLPPGLTNALLNESQLALEERALQLKLDLLNEKYDKTVSSTEPQREEWMLALPDVATTAQLGGVSARQFRANARLEMGDRSVWTDTPTDKEEKRMKRTGNGERKEVESGVSQDDVDAVRKETELSEQRQRDKEQEAKIKKHKKSKRKKHKDDDEDGEDKSLLELHQAKLKKKDKEQSEKGVRRPFNRDVDLKVNQFDDAQKKAIYKKAQLLDDRFSKGKSKFL